MMASARLVQVALFARRELGPGETGVFSKGRIPDVVIDFDGPVAAVVGEELPRGRAVSGRRGDAIDLLAGGLSGSVLPGVGALGV